MSWRWAPAAWAAAAAARAFATIMRARPSNVAGSWWTHPIGMVRLPSRITIISPRGLGWRTTAFPPRRTHRSTSSLSSRIEKNTTDPEQCFRISATSSSSAFKTAKPLRGTASTTTLFTAASCLIEWTSFNPRWSPVTFVTTATSLRS